MTAEEKQKMMDEIMQVVEKHVAKSEDKTPSTPNRYGREYGISDGDFKMMVCNVDSKFIKTSSYNLYQNILFKFKINMN